MELLETSLKLKDQEGQLVKKGYETHNNKLKDRNESVKDKTGKVKRQRVEFQKQIVDLERKLNAMNIEPDETAGPISEETTRVDIDGSQKAAESKAAEILKNLKSKLQFAQTGENAEEHFLRELPS